MEGFYRPSSRRRAHGEFDSLVKSAIWAVLVVETAIFLTGESRGFVPLLIVASACLHFMLVAGLQAVRGRALKNRTTTEARARRVVIIGTGRTALTLASHFQTRPELGRRFEGFVDDKPAGGAKTLGRVQDLERLAQIHFLDEIIVCLPDEPTAARRAVFVARRLHLDVKVVSEVYGCRPQNDGSEVVGDVHLLTLQEQDVSELGVIAKRMLDVALAAGALLLMAPALCLIALLVKLDSPGPVLYCAPRAGRRGRHFRCYKFRTMRSSTDQQKHVLRLENERAGPFFKLRKDPRVTALGGWLRRYSLDELPQLWNVMRGEMSLVGPRPHPLDDHARYAPEHLQRLTVMPGLTGLWQVTARNDPSFERNMALDREYIEKQSLRMDLWILFRTVREVALGTGV
jgi:exopolysaccharide biosynthesis polyprenyl glycosylphosphotransferase